MVKSECETEHFNKLKMLDFAVKLSKSLSISSVVSVTAIQWKYMENSANNHYAHGNPHINLVSKSDCKSELKSADYGLYRLFSLSVEQ